MCLGSGAIRENGRSRFSILQIQLLLLSSHFLPPYSILPLFFFFYFALNMTNLLEIISLTFQSKNNVSFPWQGTKI